MYSNDCKYKKAIITIDLNPKEAEFKEKGGKTRKTLKKYNSEIEGFLGAQLNIIKLKVSRKITRKINEEREKWELKHINQQLHQEER